MRTRSLIALSVSLSAYALAASPAQAQATRTFVSAVGDDANPCSRTAPCRTFAGTISKTATGGEINCIDPGSFGTVTITKSIIIDCTGMIAGQTASTTVGVTVNAPGGVVVLRGLSISGAPTALPGNIGIRFLDGASLLVEDSKINAFSGAPPFGMGVVFAPSGAATLTLSNVTISNSGTAANGGGIRIQPTGTGSAKVNIINSRIITNGNGGLVVDTTGNTGTGILLSVDNTTFYGNGVGIALSTPAATTSIGATITNSTINNNSTGIVANGASTVARLGNTTISGNNMGVLVVGGATLNSFGNNRLAGNASNGAFSGTIPQN